MNLSYDNLPGHDLIRTGLADLKSDKLSLYALLVLIGRPRLERQGFIIPLPLKRPERPEHALYLYLQNENERDAHSRYNALIRRLVSFERALERKKH